MERLRCCLKYCVYVNVSLVAALALSRPSQSESSFCMVICCKLSKLAYFTLMLDVAFNFVCATQTHDNSETDNTKLKLTLLHLYYI